VTIQDPHRDTAFRELEALPRSAVLHGRSAQAGVGVDEDRRASLDPHREADSIDTVYLARGARRGDPYVGLEALDLGWAHVRRGLYVGRSVAGLRPTSGADRHQNHHRESSSGASAACLRREERQRTEIHGHIIDAPGGRPKGRPPRATGRARDAISVVERRGRFLEAMVSLWEHLRCPTLEETP